MKHRRCRRPDLACRWRCMPFSPSSAPARADIRCTPRSSSSSPPTRARSSTIPTLRRARTTTRPASGAASTPSATRSSISPCACPIRSTRAPMLSAGPIDVYGDFIDGMTDEQDTRRLPALHRRRRLLHLRLRLAPGNRHRHRAAAGAGAGELRAHPRGENRHPRAGHQIHHRRRTAWAASWRGPF